MFCLILHCTDDGHSKDDVKSWMTMLIWKVLLTEMQSPHYVLAPFFFLLPQKGV